jgi:hypothetical protein
MMKRTLSLVLAMVMTLGTLGACGNETQPQESTTETTVAQKEEPKQFYKVLTLGHSLAVDANHMLALVAKAEGYKGLTVGTLYYSGCPLYKHVQYLKSDAREYSLYISNSDEAINPPTIMNDVTMKEAIRYLDWDLIVMQDGTFDLAVKETFVNGNIQVIQNYVNEHKMNPDAVFAWHMPWAFATEDELRSKYTASQNNPYVNGYVPYNDDRLKLYEAFTQQVNDFILPDETFRFLIPTGTAIENAMSSYMTEFDLIRDYAHANDYGRLIAAYTWYCRLTNLDKLEDIKLTTIPKAFFKSTVSAEDRVLTDIEKAILIESVNNALSTELAVTQSQYTEAPTP